MAAERWGAAMSYVILWRQARSRSWAAVPKLIDSEHGARASQKQIERANPGAETQRVWIDLEPLPTHSQSQPLSNATESNNG